MSDAVQRRVRRAAIWRVPPADSTTPRGFGSLYSRLSAAGDGVLESQFNRSVVGASTGSV
jgi:hypothetical protein